MSRLWIILFSTLLGAYVSEGYHILVLFPFPGKSHSILGYGHVNRLLEAGHEVTFLTAFPKKSDNPKLHIIDLSENKKVLEADTINLQKLLDKEANPTDMSAFTKTILDINELTFNNKDVQKMLNDDSIKFDLVLLEWMFSEFAISYAAYYDVPFIFFSSTEPHSLVLSLIDEPTNPSYHPNILSTNKLPFTFVERVKELVADAFFQGLNYFVLFSKEAAYYEKSMAPLIAKKGRVPPAYKDLRYNASLMFGNSHVSMGSALKLPQIFKPIGGYHIEAKVPPLPEDLQKLMDSAKHGVIYFSMGSNLQSKDLPDSIKAGLLKLFGSLKQTVIWKFEESFPNVPKNVHILKWAPQPSILAHPNIVLFITHGGLLSTTETIHFGVPTIGVPVFADQFSNVDRSVNRGFALRVDLTYNLAAELKVAIDEVLSNPSYTRKVKELSLVYHDRPVSPGRELVHWVEHVIKTNGAPHLRSPALHVPWYQKMYLDLAVLILTVLIVLKKIIIALCCRKKVDAKKKRE